MTNIILCGGNGTRLWPLSRTLMPKQFVKLFAGESLFQKTVKRNQQTCYTQFIDSDTEQYASVIEQDGGYNTIYALFRVGMGNVKA